MEESMPMPIRFKKGINYGLSDGDNFQNSNISIDICLILIPIFGVWLCMNWFCPPVSSLIPSRSFVKTSWGSLQPHPFKSAKLVSRKLGSKSWSVGSNGFTCGLGTAGASKVSEIKKTILSYYQTFDLTT